MSTILILEYLIGTINPIVEIKLDKDVTFEQWDFLHWQGDIIILTHWGRVTHICVSKLTIIVSDNGWSLGRHQAIIWTNAGILQIRILETNFREIFSETHEFLFAKMHLKMSVKWR